MKDVLNNEPAFLTLVRQEDGYSNSLLGVIGGMGTRATTYFHDKLHSLQEVSKEQDFTDVLIYSVPTTPDRTDYITGKSTKSPLPKLLDAAKTLEIAGATKLAMLCITSHYFYDKMAEAVNIPFFNMPDEIARYTAECRYNKVGLLATNGTIDGKFFHTAFKSFGVDVLTLSPDLQENLMSLIYDIKLGVDIMPCALTPMIAELDDNGVDAIILGCTELCVIGNENPDLINTLDILARACVNS
ncbi:MAG: amino acid racemase [Oscillospiraceae bacterium]|jgi:aspartate racemase|nr:amino acid racemase [Oscillospiraceae bacterium]